jgi:hypothetical protein
MPPCLEHEPYPVASQHLKAIPNLCMLDPEAGSNLRILHGFAQKLDSEASWYQENTQNLRLADSEAAPLEQGLSVLGCRPAAHTIGQALNNPSLAESLPNPYATFRARLYNLTTW